MTSDKQIKRHYGTQTTKCNKAEKAAIKQFCKVCHPSNLPVNMHTAMWSFHTKRNGKLEASLFACYAW